MTTNIIVKNLIIFFIFLIPFLGKFIDYPENIIFYGFPLLIFIILLFNKNKFSLNPKIIITQLVLIILFLISTLYSKNFGSSFNYFTVFLNSIFILGLSILIIKKTEFNKAFLIFSFIYSLIFLLDLVNLITFPENPRRQDNFIIQIWGHSNLSAFTVLSIPIWINLLNIKKYPIQLIPFSITLISLFLTQSRSSLIALVVGLLFLKTKKLSRINLKIIKTILIILTLIFISYISLNVKANKKSVINDRIELWQQSLIGFTQSPFIGNGPGTFFLFNHQYQENNKISYFAHNSFLGFLSENGTIFTFLLFSLIAFCLYKTFQKNNLYFVISLIALVNSLLDSTWNSPAIFIISLYFILYESIKPPPQKNSKPANKYFYVLFSFLLFIFIQSTLSQVFFELKDYKKSIFIDPFNFQTRKILISTPNLENDLWQKNLNDTLKYFPNEPTVYVSLIRTLQFPQSKPYFIKLIELQPKDYSKHLLMIANQTVNKESKDELINLIDTSIINQNRIIPPYPDAKKLSIIYYKLAIEIFKDKPSKSIDYLQEAVRINPNSRYLHIELANAYWHTGQKDKAIKQLEICQTYMYPKKHCSQYLTDHQDSSFNPPGDFINLF